MGIRVSRSLEIPDSEISVRFSRSSGPGGQHANKTSTRVELTWNVEDSEALGPRQRARLLETLQSRLDSKGALHIASEKHRSQLRNREEVTERLRSIVAQGLRRPKSRRATVPSRAAKEKRLDQKRRRSETKRRRRPPTDDL